MTWVKLDDAFPRHPKVVGLSVGAKWLYIESLCYSAKYMTDGWIPSGVIRELGGKPSVVDALVQVNLWERREHGYQIHDYEEHQTTKAEIENKREIKRRAGSAGGLARAANLRKQTASTVVAPATQADVAKRSQKTEDRKQNAETEIAAAVRAWERQSPGGVTALVSEELQTALDRGVPVDWIEAACESARDQGGYKPWKYIDSTLKRYQNEGGPNGASGRNAAASEGSQKRDAGGSRSSQSAAGGGRRPRSLWPE